MDMTWVMALKYLSWILTVGTAFVGSWFLEYTTSDKDTGRKTLTVWGRRGVVFAGLALACSLGLTVWTDHETMRKEKSATEEAARDRVKADENQKKLDTALTDFKSLATTIGTASLSMKDKSAIDQTVKNLGGIDYYQKYHPDLYKKLVNATSYAELSSAIGEGLNQVVADRIANAPECAGVPRPSKEPMAGFPAGSFKVAASAWITFMISADYVKFGFSDADDLKSLGGGSYRFVFVDGSKSQAMPCTDSKTGMSCDDKTSDDSVRAVYVELQRKTIAAIETNIRTYEVAKSTAETIRTTFSCITP